MKYLRLFLALAIAAVPAAQAGAPRTPSPAPKRAATPSLPRPAIPPAPKIEIPATSGKPAERLAERLAAPQPELAKMPEAPAANKAREDFEERAFGNWESEGGAPVQEPPAPSAAPVPLAPAPAAAPASAPQSPSRRTLMADFVEKRAKAARASTALISTIRTTAVALAATALGYWWLKGAVLDGQVGAYGTLAVMAVNLVVYSWLAGKAAYNSYRLNRDMPQAVRAQQALMRHDGLRPRTDEESAKVEEKINASAARFVLARDVAPVLLPMFGAVKAYEKGGALAPDERRAERMSYMKKFLRETLDGERDTWTLGTMAGHIAGQSEEALEAFREALWNDPRVPAAEVLKAEAAVIGVRRRLAAEHSPAYHPWRELKFARERLKEVYASIPRGLDARKAALLKDLLVRLALEEAAAGRRDSASWLNETAETLHEHGKVLAAGTAPLNAQFAEALLEPQLERLAAAEKILK